MVDEVRQIWAAGEWSCVMVSCCAGAELQLRKVDPAGGFEIVLRELYPMKSDLYERAGMLEAEYRGMRPTATP